MTHMRRCLVPKRSFSDKEGDKEAAQLISAVYLLKTVDKKEKQQRHSQINWCLFKVRGRSNVKYQISERKILSCTVFLT